MVLEAAFRWSVEIIGRRPGFGTGVCPMVLGHVVSSTLQGESGSAFGALGSIHRRSTCCATATAVVGATSGTRVAT
jgi:hypothetical protein